MHPLTHKATTVYTTLLKELGAPQANQHEPIPAHLLRLKKWFIGGKNA